MSFYGATNGYEEQRDDDHDLEYNQPQTALPPSTAIKEPPQPTKVVLDSFSISEPQQSNGSKGVRNGAGVAAPLRLGARGRRHGGGNGAKSVFLGCCPGSDIATDGFGKGDNGEKGLKVIVLSMFVFAVAVTVALFIQIAAGVSPATDADADHTISDHPLCTKVGNDILGEGGNAVDAAVAATFCMAAVAPHVTGIGGGGIMLVHMNRRNESVVIDFRESAPDGSGTIGSDREYNQNPLSATTGEGSVAVPGFVRGLAHAHKKYGSGHVGATCCNFADLVYKAIAVAKSVGASDHLVNATHSKINPDLFLDGQFANLADVFRPGGTQIAVGDRLFDSRVYARLVGNLELIAEQGESAFYEGEIAANLSRALKGAISEEDLRSYKVVERKAISANVKNFRVIASGAPSSGPQLLAILNAMEEYEARFGITPRDVAFMSNVSTVLERTEELQLGLGDPLHSEEDVAQRTAYMSDKRNAARMLSRSLGQSVGFESSYLISRPVAAHVAAMDRRDIYVSVVTSLNTWFGSKVMTSDGILLNNAISNFDLSAAGEGGGSGSRSANQLSRGQRPLTPNVVAIALDTERICGSRVAVGGSSADSVGQVLAENIVFKETLQKAIDYARIQSVNDTVHFENVCDSDEYCFPQRDVAEFEHSGATQAALPFTTVNGLDKMVDDVLHIQDARGGQPLPA